MKLLFSDSWLALDLPRYGQCLEMIFVNLGLAILYVVINLSGVPVLGLMVVLQGLYLIVPLLVRFYCGGSLTKENKNTDVNKLPINIVALIKCWYIYLSLGLVNSLVLICLSLMYIIRSKNGIWHEKISLVNLLVQYMVLRPCINCWRDSRPLCHIKRMSSMNLFHNLGCRGNVHTFFVSNVDISKFAYEGTNFVPMTGPDTWW